MVDIRAKAVVFSPEHSQRLIGRVNKVGVDYVGMLVYGLFNAAIVSAGVVPPRSPEFARSAGRRRHG